MICRHVLTHYSPNKRYDINGRWVIRVSEEVHENVDDTRSDLGELDSARVNALNEKLTVFEAL